MSCADILQLYISVSNTLVQIRTSAFKVTCDARFADMFYDKNNWPDGCDVRDWYVHKNTSAQSADA